MSSLRKCLGLFTGLSGTRMILGASLTLVIGLAVYLALPSPFSNVARGDWSTGSGVDELWTPYPTATYEMNASDVRQGSSIQQPHLYISRIRVRNPARNPIAAGWTYDDEVRGVWVGPNFDYQDYRQGGTIDIAVKAATDLRG